MPLTASRLSFLLPPLAGVGLFLVLVWGSLFAFVQHDRALVEEGAYREAENYAIAFEEYAHNIITTVDNSLHYLSQLYVQAQLRGQPMDQMLLEGYAPIKTFQFAIIGPDGILLYSNLAPAKNRVDLSDREHFRVHLDPNQNRLFISRPILGRVSGKWSIQFTRKVVMPDGSFGGVLVLSVEKSEFEQFFHRLDMGQRGLIALFGLDGWMRARGSQVQETLHDSMKEALPPDRPYFRPGGPEQGRARLPGYFDGVERIGAYRRVRDVPLVVSAQLAVDEVFANHDDRVRRAMVAGGIISVVSILGTIGLAVLRQRLMQEQTRRAADLEHARLRERMEEANRLESLGTLAGGIAHEINTPAQYVGDNLTFLEGCVPDLLKVAETAGRECTPESCPETMAALTAANLDFLRDEVPDAISQGLEGVRRISKIVQAVKEFCYPSSREPQPCNLDHLIESAATVTRNAWKYCSDLTLDLDPEAPPVMAIEGEINQMLVNLIVNAAQAIAEKKFQTPGSIVVSTKALGDSVAFSVRDDGIGIPADRHKRIFELFYTTKPPGQGTGQGLAITAAIVRRHGGTVTVESEPNKGACFTVTLPVNGPIAQARGPAVAV